jgi:nickel/cobalt transporter regulator
MRKFVISLLLASAAAAPAIAGPRDWSDRQQAHEEHQQAQESRQQVHEERAQAREQRVEARQQGAVNRPSFAGPPRGQQIQMEQRQEMAARQFNGGGRVQPQVQVEQRRGMFGGERNGASQRDAFAAQRQAYVQQQQLQQERQRVYSGDRQQRRDWQQSRSGNYQQNRQQSYQRGQQWDRNGSRDQHWNRDGHSNIRWNRDWRNDHRYDWRNYRDHHRSHFHLGLYIDPFGWGYQSFNVGYQMYPAYYGNQYWIDPGMYDLPFPPPGAAWVRYWNDAVLVDVYTGTVIDVIPGFFW